MKKNFGIFLKKEMREYAKTWKAIVLLLSFLAAAFLSPVIMYFIPKLFEVLGTSFDSGPYAALFQPTMENSYIQLFANQAEMGFIALLVIAALSITGERSKGTAILTLTKGLSRSSFVLAKFLTHVIWYTIAYVLSYGVFLGICQVLFGKCINATALALMGLYYFYGIFLLSTGMLAGCLAKKTLGAMGISFLVYVVMMLVASLPYIGEFVPGYLSVAPGSVLIGTLSMSDLLVSTLECILGSGLFLFLGIAQFRRQEL